MEADATSSGGESSSSRNGSRRDRLAGAAASAGLAKLFDRLPPHSLEAERSLIGSLLLDPGILGEVVTLVSKAEQFYSSANGAIFRAIVEVYDAHQAGDPLLIAEALKDRGLLESSGGPEVLVELAESVPSARHAAHYARIVATKAKLRRLIDASAGIIHRAFHAGESGPEDGLLIVDEAEQAIFDIAQESGTSGPEKLARILDAELHRIEQIEVGGGINGLRTAFSDLDELTNGLQPGELTILAARPSMGKTAMALNLAEQVAFGGRTPWSPKSDGGESVGVGFFSLEMARESLAQRLLSSITGIDAQKLRMGDLGLNDWQKLDDAKHQLSQLPMYVDDTPGLTIMQLRAKARRMVDQFELKAIFIDYLQLLTAPGAESRQVEVSSISRQVKALARELDVAVVCLAQLNRGTEQRENNRPRMSDLRESGSIEQDADVVALLHREAYYHRGDPTWDPNNPEFDPDNEEKMNLAELIIAKQRNGPTGTVHLTWDSSITRFKNHDFRHSSGGGGGGSYGHSADVSASSAPSQLPPQPHADQGWGAPSDASFAPEDPPIAETPPPRRPAFGAGPSTGPVDDHRDGGGPDDDEVAPF
ncbi:MAG: replicative DNA helicase [Planctomycetota bacterium]